MSKKSAATWKTYTEEEFAVLGNQSFFLLLLFMGNACSSVSLFHKRFEELSSLRHPREHVFTKETFKNTYRKLTLKGKEENSRCNDSFTKETLH